MSLKYFLQNTTIYNSRNKGGCVYDIQNLTLGIYYNKPIKAFLEHQLSKNKPTPLLAMKNLRFIATVIFLYNTFIFYKCNYKYKVQVIQTVFKWYLTKLFFRAESSIHFIK